MKKILTALSLIFVFSLSGCCLYYNLTTVAGVDIGYSKIEKNCFIANILWTNGESQDIVLPSYYDGIPVKELGGYFGRGVPSPFCIDTDINILFPDADYYYGTDEATVNEETNPSTTKEIYEYKFTVTLPSELEKITYVINNVSVADYNSKDGSVTEKIFLPTYYFIISEENEFFYTESGYLYNKKTDELITDFKYATAEE